jgi:hypothetical protein
MSVETHAIAQPIAAHPRAAIVTPARIVLVAVALGLLAQLLFFQAAPGVNVPIAAAAIIAAGWRLRSRGRRLAREDAWLPLATLACAGFVAVRDDPMLVALDLMAAAVLSGASLAAFGGHRIMARPLLGIGRLGLRFAGWAAGAAGWTLADAAREAPSGAVARGKLAESGPVLRGLAISVPLALIFIGLFSAADAVFADLVGDLTRLDVDLSDLIGRTAIAVVAGWVAAGALAFMTSAALTATAPAQFRRLGATEAVTVLVVIDALFTVFVILQAAYLFGGRDTLAAVGMTYAEYARRGFFELIAVAAMAGGLVLALETFVRRRTPAYVAAAIGLAVLTSVVLASAALRLRLYQDAYGWTELRFYAFAIIVWLAIGLVAAAVAIAANRGRWLPRALVVAAVVVGLAVNAIGPVSFVAEQNVARVVNPELVPDFGYSGLDSRYLAELGDDATPALIDALPNLEPRERHDLRAILIGRLEALREREDLTSWQAWNLSRVAARNALEGLTAR